MARDHRANSGAEKTLACKTHWGVDAHFRDAPGDGGHRPYRAMIERSYYGRGFQRLDPFAQGTSPTYRPCLTRRRRPGAAFFAETTSKILAFASNGNVFTLKRPNCRRRGHGEPIGSGGH